jgi:hypothetical protein
MASVRRYRRTGDVTDRLLDRLVGSVSALSSDDRVVVYSLCGTPWPAREDFMLAPGLSAIVDLVFDRRGHRLSRRRPAQTSVLTPRDILVTGPPHDN